MAQVRITGWRYGLNKVSMTTTIRDALGLGLAEAKRCTDRVLDGEVVVPMVGRPGRGISRIRRRGGRLGARFRPESTGESS